MTTKERLAEVEQTFNTKKAERDKHLELAANLLTEMTQLQGQFSLLQEIAEQESQAKPSVKVANEAKPKVKKEKK